MFDNRQNAAFEELIKKEQVCRSKWTATHGRSLALQDGQLSSSGMVIANESFLHSKQNNPGMHLPAPNAMASQLLHTGRIVGTGRFLDHNEQTEADYEAACYAKYNTSDKFTEKEDDFSCNPVKFSATKYDAKNLGLEDGDYPIVRKKFVRTVEVPVIKTVKVPIRMKDGKNVAQAYHMVQEEYTDYEDKPAVRNREVWVKKVVKEQYTVKVPVKKVRSKKIALPPGVTYDVVSEAEANAYRVDEVEDVEHVEIEEICDFELRPVVKGKSVPVSVNSQLPMGVTLGQGQGRIGQRSVYGIVEKDDPVLHRTNIIDTHQPHAYNEMISKNQPQVVPPQRTKKSNTYVKNLGTRTMDIAMRKVEVEAAKKTQQRAARKAFQTSLNLTQSAPVANQVYEPRVGSNNGAADALQIQITDANKGVAVVFIHPQSAAAVAGLGRRDIITRVNNRPVINAGHFETVLNATDGAIVLEVLRGAIPMKVTVPAAKLPKRF